MSTRAIAIAALILAGLSLLFQVGGVPAGAQEAQICAREQPDGTLTDVTRRIPEPGDVVLTEMPKSIRGTWYVRCAGDCGDACTGTARHAIPKPLTNAEKVEVAVKATASDHEMVLALWARVVGGDDKATDALKAKLDAATAAATK